NNPMGACPRCDGLGSISFFDPKRVVAFPQLSLASGAIKGWDRRNQFYFQMLQSLAKHFGFDLEKGFDRLPERVQQMILYGSDKGGPPGNERAIFEVSNWPLKQTGEFFRGMKLEGQRQAIADKIVKEIVSRLQFLNNVGLDYLSLDRSAETLSGGEAQRIRLASQIGSGLTGVLNVIDEPCTGLH